MNVFTNLKAKSLPRLLSLLELLSLSVLSVLILCSCGGSNDDASAPLDSAPSDSDSIAERPKDNGSTVTSVSDTFMSLKGGVERRPASTQQDDLKYFTQLSQNNGQFAIDFFRQQLTLSGDENVVFSPYSISAAFAMLYAGSASDTQQEFIGTFYFKQSSDDFHQAFNTLDQALLSQENDDDFTLNIVNDQWGEVSYDFNPSYLNTLSEYYDADLKVADMIGNPEEVRLAVNDWIAQQTQALIKDLLPQNSVTVDSRLILTNAIYLNAKWLNPFPAFLTADRAFSLLSGEEIQVPTMERRGIYNVYSSEDEQLIELPYKNTDWAMFLISTSRQQFSDFEESFDHDKLDDMISKANMSDVEIFLPKFSFGSSVNLEDTLKPLGLTLAFDSATADFSPMNRRVVQELYIQSAVHKAFIIVDEAGTEAAAATGAVVGIESLPPQIQFNQPFIFVIQHKPTKTSLFIGRVTNPLDQ